MENLVTLFQFAAAVTAAILVWACLHSSAKCQETTTRQSSRTLMKIVDLIEQNEYGTLQSVSRNNGYCGVEINCDGASYELTVDPVTGIVVARHCEDAQRSPPQRKAKKGTSGIVA